MKKLILIENILKEFKDIDVMGGNRGGSTKMFLNFLENNNLFYPQIYNIVQKAKIQILVCKHKVH